MKKRLLSALLALVMVLALLPVSVFADPSPTGVVATEDKPEVPQGDTSEENEETEPEDVPSVQDDSKIVPRTPTGGSTPVSGVWTVKYAESINKDWVQAGLTVDPADLPLWVAESPTKNTTSGVKDYGVVNSGVAYGGKWYSSIGLITATGDISKSNVSIIGSEGGSIPAKITSMTLDIYSTGSLTLTGGADLTTLKITNAKYATNKIQPAVNWTAGAKLTTLTLENVNGTSINLAATDGQKHNVSITLNNAKIGALTLTGVGTDGKTSWSQARSINASKGSVIGGAVSLTGNGSSVKLDDTTLDSSANLTVKGDTGSISITGGSTVGDVEVATLSANKTTYPSITIGGSATVGNISASGGNPSINSAKATVSISGAHNDVGDITFKNATVNVTGGKVGDVALDGGSLTVNGTYITVKDVTLNGEAALSVSGSESGNHNTVGEIAAAKTARLTIPADTTNLYGKAGATNLPDYVSQNVMGGTWRGLVNPAALHSSLLYYLQGSKSTPNNTTYTYYNSAQLNAALNAQVEGSKGTGDAVLRATNSDYTSATIGEVRFMNGNVAWGVLEVVGREPIVLPSSINNVKLSNWYDGKVTYPVGGNYDAPLPAEMKSSATDGDGNTVNYVELNGSGGVNTGDATKLLNVDVYTGGTEADNVRASLNGNVITLTGAVDKGTSDIKLKLTTDAMTKNKNGKEIPVQLDVLVTYDSATGVLRFTNQDTNHWSGGLTLQADSTGLGVLRLSNGTTYTLNGSGLKVRSSIRVAGYDTLYPYSSYMGGHYETGWAKGTGTYSFMEVTVNVPSLKSDIDKQVVIDLLTGDSGTAGAQFDWAESPAMKQAINAVLAGITETEVDQWLSQVRREAWTKINPGVKYETSNGIDTHYDEVWLVPYLAINVTGYSVNGTITFTATPSYRIEVRQLVANYDNGYSNVFYDAKKTETYQNTPYVKVIKAGTSLGALTGEIGEENSKYLLNTPLKGLKITFGTGFTTFAGSDDLYMHQDNTYAYKYDNNGSNPDFVVSHAGNSLGTMVISKSEPLVTLYNSYNEKTETTGTLLGYYNTLQAAVDDARNEQHINVDQAYKGSMSVNVTGNARKFTIQANGLNVVAANASGGLVDLNPTGGLYTVQLNRDSTAVVDATTATIAVNGVLNGSAVVSATTAKAGTAITVTCTPAVGYRTNNVTVSAHMTATNTNAAVSVTRVSDNVYSFKVPQGADKITVTPNFVLGTVSAIPFTDVATNHWAYNSVKYVYDNGLMNGVNTAGTQFGGTQTLNRAMVVTILYRAAGSPYVGTTSRFSDVANNTWYSQAVAWANQNNIVTGYTNGTFQPNWAITRQELATILYRYNTTYKGRATTGSTTLANFPDQGNVSDWATAGMQWAVGNGIVNGITNGYSTTLSPSGSATRYEAATMLMRYGQGMGL